MNQPRQTTGTGKAQDVGYKSSPFYSGIDGITHRVSEALLYQELGEEMDKRAKAANAKLFNTPPDDHYRGISPAETEITKRITYQTFTPENDADYRQQVAMREFLEEQKKQLEHDRQLNIQYAKDLKQALSSTL